jgi:hypothetical protein
MCLLPWQVYPLPSSAVAVFWLNILTELFRWGRLTQSAPKVWSQKQDVSREALLAASLISCVWTWCRQEQHHRDLCHLRTLTGLQGFCLLVFFFFLISVFSNARSIGSNINMVHQHQYVLMEWRKQVRNKLTPNGIKWGLLLLECSRCL